MKSTPFTRDPVAFFDAYIKFNELGQPFRLMDHQREIFRLAFDFDQDGLLPWDTIIYSCDKKSGKTTINGGFTIWWGYTQEAPNELDILANDGEQAASRVFKTVSGIIRNNPELAGSAKLDLSKISLSNGTLIQWLTCDHAGSAGSNHGLTSWDELWGYTSEASRRLWEELTPVPTRRNSIRLITTYAGFENESQLLRELYLLGVGKDEHPDGQGARLHPTLPIYGNREARIFCYWDHEPRMPWQTPQYYETQRRNLRPNTYLRLHENRWTVSASRFITPELWDSCVSAALSALLSDLTLSVYVGVDASMKHDYAAVVVVARVGNTIRLVCYRMWKPTKDEPLDIEQTIEADLRQLRAQYRVVKVLCDPYQVHRTITSLKAEGFPIEEFPQTVANTTKMGTNLFDLIKGGNLLMYPDAELREQALNAVALETPLGFRLAKEKASRKIDAIVALSMACVAALDTPVLAPWGFFSEGRSIGEQPAEPVASTSNGPTRERTIAEIERLDEGCRSPEEQQRLNAFYEARKKAHVETQLDKAIRTGNYFPGASQHGTPTDVGDMMENIRQTFVRWR